MADGISHTCTSDFNSRSLGSSLQTYTWLPSCKSINQLINQSINHRGGACIKNDQQLTIKTGDEGKTV